MSWQQEQEGEGILERREIPAQESPGSIPLAISLSQPRCPWLNEMASQEFIGDEAYLSQTTPIGGGSIDELPLSPLWTDTVAFDSSVPRLSDSSTLILRAELVTSKRKPMVFFKWTNVRLLYLEVCWLMSLPEIDDCNTTASETFILRFQLSSARELTLSACLSLHCVSLEIVIRIANDTMDGKPDAATIEQSQRARTLGSSLFCSKYVYSTNRTGDVGSAGQSLIDSTIAENQNETKLSHRKRGRAEKLIRLEDLQPHFGKSTREEAAKSLGVSVSTVKRICRQHEIPRWPFRKVNKDEQSLLESVVECDAINKGGDTHSVAPRLDAITVAEKQNKGKIPYGISSEDIQQQFGMSTCEESAKSIGFSVSPECLFRKLNKNDNSMSQPKGIFPGAVASIFGPANLNGYQQNSQLAFQPTYVNRSAAFIVDAPVSMPTQPETSLEEIPNFSLEYPLCSNPTPMQLAMAAAVHSSPAMTTMQDVWSVTVKAMYGGDMIKFQLSSSWKMVDLEEEVAKRLKIKVGSFNIKYMDEESDLILVACDEAVRDCIVYSRRLGWTTIKMEVQPIS